MRREGYGPLRSGAPRMHRFASIREGRINIDGVDQPQLSLIKGPNDQGQVPVPWRPSMIPFLGFVPFLASHMARHHRHHQRAM